jgi:glyoxylate reductase
MAGEGPLGVAIVGCGNIAREMFRMARCFGFRRLLACDPYVEADAVCDLGIELTDMDTVLRESDFVSLHVNLTPETRHLINADTLALMKPSAVLVNTSRGPVIDQAALHAALRDGRLFAAALDVTDPEPTVPDDPLLSLDNCLVVPHIASASQATRAKMAELASTNLLAGLRGERLPTCINPEVYESGESERESERAAPA